jgi:hypothetical protein
MSENTKYNQYKVLQRIALFDPTVDEFTKDEFNRLSEEHQDHVLRMCSLSLDYQIDNHF